MKKKQYIRDGRAPIPKKELTSRIMSLIRAKNTTPEIVLRKAIRKLGIESYKIHDKRLPGTPDISFSDSKMAIFVNGCYWHRCPYCRPSIPKTHKAFWLNKFKNNMNRDKKKRLLLKKCGYKTMTFWECQIKRDANIIANKILKAVKQY